MEATRHPVTRRFHQTTLNALRSEPVDPGYFLCYGMPNDEHIVMPTDLANKVETTNGILAGLERSLRYVRVPAPKRCDDNAYYAPFAVLRLREGCGLYLGISYSTNGGSGSGGRGHLSASEMVMAASPQERPTDPSIWCPLAGSRAAAI